MHDFDTFSGLIIFFCENVYCCRLILILDSVKIYELFSLSQCLARALVRFSKKGWTIIIMCVSGLVNMKRSFLKMSLNTWKLRLYSKKNY